MPAILPHWRKALIPLLLCVFLMVTACTKAPSPYAQVQKETSRRGAPSAVVKSSEQGATFNKFFPVAKGYDVIPAQEKKGFAEYKVTKDGKTLAMLSISDTLNVPGSAAKYQSSTSKVGNYPSVEQGTTATGILVNGRYQVKVLSRDPAFVQANRVAWLQKFDLQGLAKLKGAPTTASAKLPAVTAPKAPLLPSPQPRLVPQPAV
jgi:hypothetical protein